MIIKNNDNISTLTPKSPFLRAVIENNEDPDELGRCQVRIIGLHSEDETKVKSDDLPWAELIHNHSFGGGMSGYGISSIPLKGTWVWVFLDAGDWNRPIIIGSIYGTSKVESDGKGFSDPDKNYPDKDRLNEPDLNRYMSGRKISETLIEKIKKTDIDKGIPTATGQTWDELPELNSKSKYPYNIVYETTSGSFVEFDESNKKSRQQWFHKSGTYWEIVDIGDFTLKVKNDLYNIIDNNSMTLVKKDMVVTIQENHELKIDKDDTVLIGGNRKITVQKDLTQIYEGKSDTTVTGAVTETYNSTLDTKVTGAANESYSAGQTTDGGPSITITAGIIKLN